MNETVPDTTNWRVETVKDLNRFDALEPAWRILHDATGQHNPFVSHEWLSAWLKVFLGQRNLRVILLWEGDYLTAAWPMLIDWIRGPIRLYTAPFNYYTDWPQPLFDPDRVGLLPALLKAVRAEMGRWSAVSFRYVDPDAPQWMALRSQAPAMGWHWRETPTHGYPVIPTVGEYERYRGGIVGIKTKERDERRLKRQGILTHVTMQRPDEIETAFNALLHISRNTWKAKAGTAIASDKRLEELMRLAAAKMADRNWWRFEVLNLDGQPISFWFNLRVGGVVYLYKPGFHEAFRNFAPGNILQKKVIEGCFADPDIRECNLLGIEGHGKDHWTKRVLPRVDILVWPAGSAFGHLVWWSTQLRRQVKTQLKSAGLTPNSRLYRLLRRRTN